MDVRDMLAAGSDAMSNLFEVIISLPGNDVSTEAASNNLTLRINAFTPPTAAVVAVDVPYKGRKIRKHLPAITLAHQVAVVFRIDANMTVYKQLMLSRAFNANGFDNQLDVPPQPGTMLVNILDTQDKRTGGWYFANIQLESVVVSALNHTTSTPLMATATFSFSTYTDL